MQVHTFDGAPGAPHAVADVLCHYVIVRTDLPPGFREAQVGHAIGRSLEHQHPEETFVVVLAVRNEAELHAQADRLCRRGCQHVLITENDGAFAGQATAIGLRPGLRSKMRRHVSSLAKLR